MLHSVSQRAGIFRRGCCLLVCSHNGGRFQSSEAGRGRGSGVPDTENAIGASEAEGSVPGSSVEGQFDDSESESKSTQPLGSLLQDIMAKEREDAASRAEGGRPSGSLMSSSASRASDRPVQSTMQDLLRLFQPKSNPPAETDTQSDGPLFRPRASSEASFTLDTPIHRSERDSLRSTSKEPSKEPIEFYGLGERDALGDRTIYSGNAFKTGLRYGDANAGEEKERAPLSLSEIFARSKAQEAEEKPKQQNTRMTYRREAPAGRGRPSASSEFRQRVLGLPPEEPPEAPEPRNTQRAKGRGAWASVNKDGSVLGRREDSARDNDDNDLPVHFERFVVPSNVPQDKPRKNRPARPQVDRATYEKREAEKDEADIQEAAKETAEEIEYSEWYEAMQQGYQAQPEELGVPHVPEVEIRDHLSLSLEPEYTMETFGTLPELDDPPTTSLEDSLTACKDELMALSGIEDEETWQAMLKRTLDRTSELEALVKRYNPNKNPQVTARQQQQILGDIYREMPERGSPLRTPEMVAYVTRALQTLEHNCRWPLQRKKAVMTSLVAQVGKYDGSKKSAKLMQRTYG